MNQIVNPKIILEKGRSILAPLMEQFKFAYQYIGSGRGSGGRFAAGVYIKYDRKLELHFRHSLGLVTYHIGKYHLEHEIYMKFLSVRDKCQYPGFSNDPLDGFRHLKYDLENFCADFLYGDGMQFKIFAQSYLDNPNQFKSLP